MVTTTNTLVNLQPASVDFSTKNSKAVFTGKVTSEVYKNDTSKSFSKIERSKNEEFKEVLSSKSNSKDDDSQRINDINNKANIDDMSKVDELKEKLKELEEKSDKADSEDKVEDILTQLLNLLNKLEAKKDALKLNREINSENLKNIIEGIKENKSSDDLNSIMEKLMALMKKDSVKEALDADSLKAIKNLLSNLNSKLADNSEIKGSIKNLMSEISNTLDDKQNGKVLTLEDMLSNKYSQDNKESSLGDGKSNKEASKEEKFLNSLLGDDKDSSMNKINLFASRSQVIQNQSGDTIRGLTINKATFANDLIKDVKFMSTNAMKELTVKVNPGDIGEITIKLIQEDGVMKANLKANSKEATALLAQNLADIKKQLNEQNIKIADINIEIYRDDTTFFSEQGFGGQLSEEQRRNDNSNNSNAGNYSTTSEEDLADNIVSSSSNLEVFV